VRVLLWTKRSCLLPRRAIGKQNPDGFPRTPTDSANSIYKAAGRSYLPVVADVIVLDQAMKILPVEDGPEEGAVRQEEMFPLIPDVTGIANDSGLFRIIQSRMAEAPISHASFSNRLLAETVSSC
jgi:hypothetical protein